MTHSAIKLAGRHFFALLLGCAVALVAFGASALAAEVEHQADDWNRTVRAAELEGQVVLYSLSEIGDAIANGGFQKKFPKIKISVVTARGGEHVSRVMAERRAGKFLVDVGNLGNTSPYTLYQSKVLDPIASAYVLPEVKDESKWWQGKQHFIDPEGKYILVYVGAPLFLVGYNAKLLRDQAGNNLYYTTNSITLAGGESLDVILDASDPAYVAGQVFFLYTPNLDHLANDAENFGGLMTEVHIN